MCGAMVTTVSLLLKAQTVTLGQEGTMEILVEEKDEEEAEKELLLWVKGFGLLPIVVEWEQQRSRFDSWTVSV